jgi:hypothetical protein
MNARFERIHDYRHCPLGTKEGTSVHRSRPTRTAPAFRALKVRLPALALLLLTVVAPAGADPGNDNRAPELGECQHLQAPAGHKVAFRTYAVGFQVYRWNGSIWSFVGPEALLFANAGGNGLVGIHYGGPTWESVSGSKVVGDGPNALRCIPDPAAIPWLRLEAVSSEGPGIFDGVTYIQRVNTVGGLAPTVPGNVVDQIAKVPYTTEYFFYRAHP